MNPRRAIGSASRSQQCIKRNASPFEGHFQRCQPTIWFSPSRRTSTVLCMAHPRRVAKVSSQIQRELGQLLLADKRVKDAIDPERAVTDMVTAVASITQVYVANDLQHVKAYVSIYSDPRGKKTAFNNLKNMEGYVRNMIGQRVRLRLTPEIVFVYDDSLEEAELVSRVLEEEQRRLYGGEAGTASDGLDEDDEDEDDDDDEGFFDDAESIAAFSASSDDIFKQPGPFESMFSGGATTPAKGSKRR